MRPAAARSGQIGGPFCPEFAGFGLEKSRALCYTERVVTLGLMFRFRPGHGERCRALTESQTKPGGASVSRGKSRAGNLSLRRAFGGASADLKARARRGLGCFDGGLSKTRGCAFRAGTGRPFS